MIKGLRWTTSAWITNPVHAKQLHLQEELVYPYYHKPSRAERTIKTATNHIMTRRAGFQQIALLPTWTNANRKWSTKTRPLRQLSSRHLVTLHHITTPYLPRNSAIHEHALPPSAALDARTLAQKPTKRVSSRKRKESDSLIPTRQDKSYLTSEIITNYASKCTQIQRVLHTMLCDEKQRVLCDVNSAAKKALKSQAPPAPKSQAPHA